MIALPLIGKGCDVYAVFAAPNVRRPLLFQNNEVHGFPKNVKRLPAGNATANEQSV